MNTFKSKWGYHPVSVEVCRKLRFLNGVYSKSQHLASAWERWDRKMPHNRVQKRSVKDAEGKVIGREIVRNSEGRIVPWAEPQTCELFHEKAEVSGYKCENGNYKSCMVTVIKDNGFGAVIRKAAKQARMPYATETEVPAPYILPEEVDRLYEIAKKF